MGPKDLPEPVSRRLAAALEKALGNAELKEAYAAQGLSVKTQTPAQFGAFVRAEIDKWAAIVRETGIEPQ